MEQPGPNNTHETTLISSVGDNYGSARSPIVRHNYVNCTLVNSDGSRFSSEYIAIQSITTPTASNQEFTVTTKRPHNRAEGQNVLINSVYGDASYQTSHPYFNQPFKIKALDSASPLTKFKCEFHYLQADFPSNFPAAYFNPNFPPFIGVDFHGPSALSGTGCVMEGNAVHDCDQGLYTDTGSTRDMVVRDNYCSGGFLGVNFNFNPEGGGGASAARSAGSLTQDPNNGKIATLTIPTGAALLEVSIGDAVTVLGAQIGNPGQPAPDGTYNGTYSVLSVATDKKSFAYEMKSDPGSHANSPTTQLPITFRSRWQVRRLAYENNYCDLYRFDSSSALAPRGVISIGYAPTPASLYAPGPPFMFPQAVFRENIFRHLDGAPGSIAANGVHSFGFRVLSLGNSAIEQNVIGLSDPHVIHYVSSQNVRAFGNVTPDGKALPYSEDLGGGTQGPFQEQDSLDSKVADALVMSFL